MTSTDHLTTDLLVRAVDEELTPLEAAAVEWHVAGCQECRQKMEALRSLSVRVEAAVAVAVPAGAAADREALACAIDARPRPVTSLRPDRVLYRFGWAMGIAATLTIAMLVAPQIRHRGTQLSVERPQTASAFEIDGETFTPLPYSNPDLPLSGPHVVQMRVPVSSLTEAGVVFEPVSSEVTAPDRSVLADVLLGMDGQPLAVHVLSID